MAADDLQNGAGTVGLPADAGRVSRQSKRIGRPPVHGLKTLRRAVTQLTTRRLDGRCAVAVALRRFKHYNLGNVEPCAPGCRRPERPVGRSRRSDLGLAR